MKLPLLASLILAAVGEPKPVPQVWLFDDFESAEHTTAHHLTWIALGDDLFGGASTLALTTVPGGRNGSGHAFLLQGTIGSADAAFAGAWAPLDGQGRPVDLSAFDSLRFFARGEGSFQAGLRSGSPTAAANFMSPFTPGRGWNVVEIPFDRLSPVGPGSSGAQWSPQEVHFVGITSAPGTHGPFRLEIDDLELVYSRAFDPAPPTSRGVRRRSVIPARRPSFARGTPGRSPPSPHDRGFAPAPVATPLP